MSAGSRRARRPAAALAEARLYPEAQKPHALHGVFVDPKALCSLVREGFTHPPCLKRSCPTSAAAPGCRRRAFPLRRGDRNRGSPDTVAGLRRPQRFCCWCARPQTDRQPPAAPTRGLPGRPGPGAAASPGTEVGLGRARSTPANLWPHPKLPCLLWAHPAWWQQGRGPGSGDSRQREVCGTGGAHLSQKIHVQEDFGVQEPGTRDDA